MQRERRIDFKNEPVEDILFEIGSNLPSYCKNVQSSYFSAPFSERHYELLDDLAHPRYDPVALKMKNVKQSRTALAAPRGVGKTTCVVQGKLSRSILFGWCQYALVIGASQEEATRQTEGLKESLVNNPVVTHLFGDIRSEKFAEDAWEVVIGRQPDGTFHHRCYVRPVGPQSKVRGTRYGWRRPDFIHIDDIQNDENVNSEDWRNKIERWMNTAVLNSVDRRRSFEIVYTGTILVPGDVTTRLLNPVIYPGWDGHVFTICDSDYNTLWPEYMTTEEIHALVEEHRDRGALAQFCREYMNQPISDEERSFKQEYFKYYQEKDHTLNSDGNVVNCVTVDPARTISAGSCKTAIGVVGVDCTNSAWYIRDMDKGRYTPATLYDKVVEKVRLFNCRVVIVEVTGLHEYIVQPLRDALSLAHLGFVTIIEVRPRDKKEKRAGGLIVYYKRGIVYHNKTVTTSLEHHLTEWPSCSEWDEVDIISQMIPAMEQEEWVFWPSDAKEDSTPEEEYEALLREDEQEPDFEIAEYI